MPSRLDSTIRWLGTGQLTKIREADDAGDDAEEEGDVEPRAISALDRADGDVGEDDQKNRLRHERQEVVGAQTQPSETLRGGDCKTRPTPLTDRLQELRSCELLSEDVLIEKGEHGRVPDARVLRLQDPVVLVGEVQKLRLDAVTLEVGPEAETPR